MRSSLSGTTLLVGSRLDDDLVSGARLGFELAIAGFESRGLPHRVINLGSVGFMDRLGTFNPRRAISTLRVLLVFWARLFEGGIVRMTIASSPFGFLRDALMIWPARLMGRKLVLHLYGGGYGAFYDSQPKWLQALIGRTLSAADVIIVEGKLLEQQFGFVPDISKKIRVVPNALPRGLHPDRVTVKSLPRHGPLQLLYLSNMIESKGYLDVLAACRVLKERLTIPFHCHFCGGFVRVVVDGVDIDAAQAQARFHELVQQWGLRDRVTYHGVVGGSLKEKLLREAHLFLLPTSYPWEGQPFSIIEALAFGIPVVATGHRGIPEQVIHGVTGFLVAPQAPDQIAAAIVSVAQDGEGYRGLSENARAHFTRNFTQEVHFDRLLAAILG